MSDDVITRPRRSVAPPDPSVVRDACLVVLHGADIGQRIALGRAAAVIGRGTDCEVQIDEENISRRHARIDPPGDGADGGGYAVVDLGSTNGTFLNDRPVQSCGLRHGDHLQIGRTIFKFLAGGHIEAAYHEEIYRLVTTDGLTGLSNRRALEETLVRELNRARRYQRPLSLVMIDIDHFKGLNDAHGHLAGDAVLRQLGALLRANLRRDDYAGRMGGEEFALVLPEVDSAGAFAVADKLRRLTEQRSFEYDALRMTLTLSAGVTSRRPDDTDPGELIRRADELLFEAKRTGRNLVRM